MPLNIHSFGILSYGSSMLCTAHNSAVNSVYTHQQVIVDTERCVLVLYSESLKLALKGNRYGGGRRWTPTSLFPTSTRRYKKPNTSSQLLSFVAVAPRDRNRIIWSTLDPH